MSLTKFVLLHSTSSKKNPQQKAKLKKLTQIGNKQNQKFRQMAMKIGKEFSIKQFSFEIPEHEFLLLHDRSQQRMEILKKFSKVLKEKESGSL